MVRVAMLGDRAAVMRPRHDLQMDRPPVTVALALAEGVVRGDTDADALLIAGFDSVEEAARAHAYLSGFVLELLADCRSEDITATVKYVRSKLDS
jgi:hypothetical protein